VFRMPMKRWSPFVLAGEGALVFDPNSHPSLPVSARSDRVSESTPVPYTLLIDSWSAPGVDAVIKEIECEKSVLLWNT
jgi:hypothetical protein